MKDTIHCTHRAKRTIGDPEAHLHPKVRVWLLRLLVPLGTGKAFIGRDGLLADSVAYALQGHQDHIDGLSFADLKNQGALQRLRELYEDSETDWDESPDLSRLTRNIDRLVDLVGLSVLERRLLDFVIHLNNDRILDEAAEKLGVLSTTRMFQVLTVLLDAPNHEIRAALSPSAALVRSGLVAVDFRGQMPLRDKIDLISDSFADAMASSDADPLDMLRAILIPGKPARLTLADFDHLGDALSLALPHLMRSADGHRPGVNILIYGAPGTGKSELVKVLAQELDLELFEVSSESESGKPLNGEARLRAYRAAQSFLSQKPAMIAFDEVEDVFSDGTLFGQRSTAQSRKAWLNCALEGNPIPAAWLTNDIRSIDSAFVRRFDLVIEVPVPPKAKRLQIVRTASESVVHPQVIEWASHCDELAPAVVKRASDVLKNVQNDLNENARTAAFSWMIKSTLKAQGHAAPRSLVSDVCTIPFTSDYLNTSMDLSEVAHGLRTASGGRLCMYGPPGTGKSAFAKWLPEHLGLPLSFKRASDMVSPYVGETERNIARAFQDAQSDGSILLFDEVDSFLADRTTAQRSWEVSQVNEFLTQMDAFTGIFIATTNMVDYLEQAALRRFDLKVAFDYLLPQQICDLLQAHLHLLSLAPAQDHDVERLTSLKTLTPGDFALVLRQSRFRPITSSATLIDTLVNECRLKKKCGTSRLMGFV